MFWKIVNDRGSWPTTGPNASATALVRVASTLASLHAPRV